MEYDFETKTAIVEFAEGAAYSTQAVALYFDEASDSKVELIKIMQRGKPTVEIRRPFVV
jgi:hypothetical protein